MDMLAKHMIDLVEAIRESYEKGRYMPCLVLLYSGMDVAASLETSNGSSVGSRFEYWVERYMLNGRTLNCSARDLYAARCAVVHTFTPTSDLSKNGKARVIGYAFGPAEVEKLDQAGVLLGRTGQVNVHVGELIKAFRLGFADYMKEVEGDPIRFEGVRKAAGLWTVSIKTKLIDDYLESRSVGPSPDAPS
jgi:hypothetical protein